MKITASNLIRWAGLSAMVAGIYSYVIQDVPSSLIFFRQSPPARWAIVHYMSIAMCFFGLLGIAGIYARQVEKAGWLGLVGFLLLSLWSMCSRWPFTFVEAFILPLLATEAPKFVEGFLGSCEWVRRRDEPRSPRNRMYANRVSVYARRPAVWHRDVPRRHPAALGGRPACLRDPCRPS